MVIFDEKVESLIDRAWEAKSPNQRAKFARKALSVDHKSIDAYVALALSVDTLAEHIALLREAVRCGEALWPDQIKKPPKDFFGFDIDTRPFMRATHNLALALWKVGDREEAAALADRLMRLNKSDNQGARYLALAWHPVLGNWARVDALLKKYGGEKRTEDLYALCLNCFRTGEGADSALAKAVAVNPYVPALLISEKRQRESADDGWGVAIGSPEEAQAYAEFNRGAWKSVPNALRWLKSAAAQTGAGNS